MELAVSCWHCRSRRWKCDSTRPACQKCIKFGIDCPGYGATKPLRFLDPRAPSNFRTAKSTKVSSSVKSLRHKKANVTDSAPTNATACMMPQRQGPLDQVSAQLGRSMSIPGEKSLVEGLEFMCLSLRPCYEGSYLHDMVQPASSSSIMRRVFHPDPRPVEIMAGIRVCSLLAFVEFNKSHLPHASLVELRTRLLEYTGAAYEMMMDAAVMKNNRTYSAATVAEGIHYLMFLEVMHMRREPTWQIHARAAARLYLQNAVLSSAPTYAAFQFAMLMIINNTTSPRDQQVHAETFRNHMAWIERYHSQIKFASFAGPWPLVAQIIQINHLRAQRVGWEVRKPALHKLINEIENFDEQEWIVANTSAEHRSIWEYLCDVTKTAVAAFAFASLSPRAVPTRRAAEYRAALFSTLDAALLPSDYLVRFGLQWHFIVAGFLAKNGTVAQRDRVREYLKWSGQISEFRGRALDVLERFWRSETLVAWDECFDEPYFFVGF